MDKYSPQYEVEILSNDGVTGTAIGYLATDESVECRLVYMNAERSYTSYDSKIIPLNEGDTVTESAVQAFKTIMENYLSSISEKSDS